MCSDAPGAGIWFDAIAIFSDAGTTVRWVAAEKVHTTTAHHPRNDNQSLRNSGESRCRTSSGSMREL